MITDDEELMLNKIEAADLEVMSIKALGLYVTDLQSEIKRVEAKITFKKKARLGAESFFQ